MLLSKFFFDPAWSVLTRCELSRVLVALSLSCILAVDVVVVFCGFFCQPSAQRDFDAVFFLGIYLWGFACVCACMNLVLRHPERSFSF